jgi:sec-independent protein translocase protein TatA
MALLGPQEILLVFLAIVLLFGAAKLPELAKSMGKAMGEFKKGQVEVEKELESIKSSPPPSTKPEVELTRVQKMAKNLGIDITGKTEDQLLAEIEKKIEKK